MPSPTEPVAACGTRPPDCTSRRPVLFGQTVVLNRNLLEVPGCQLTNILDGPFPQRFRRVARTRRGGIRALSISVYPQKSSLPHWRRWQGIRLGEGATRPAVSSIGVVVVDSSLKSRCPVVPIPTYCIGHGQELPLRSPSLHSLASDIPPLHVGVVHGEGKRTVRGKES